MLFFREPESSSETEGGTLGSSDVIAKDGSLSHLPPAMNPGRRRGLVAEEEKPGLHPLLCSRQNLLSRTGLDSGQTKNKIVSA